MSWPLESSLSLRHPGHAHTFDGVFPSGQIDWIVVRKRPVARMSAIRKAPMQRHEGGYYIRLLARDRPGSAAAIARRLAQQQISIESIVQRQTAKTQSTAAPGRSGEPVPVILVTYATTEDAVRKALAAVRRDRVISGRPQVIRIEKN
jgi:homoserine dehydrogenase